MFYFSCFVYATITLSGVELGDSRTSVDNSLSYTMYSKLDFPLKTHRSHVWIYLWKRQAHEILSKTFIEGDILGKIQGVYTVRRNLMYNLHVIRIGDSRYTKAKSSNNLLVIDRKINSENLVIHKFDKEKVVLKY